jgi:hypothetical protein
MLNPPLMAIVGSTRELRIRGGNNDGRMAIEVAEEAASWVESYLYETIRNAGFDPDERIEWDDFLLTRERDRPRLSSVLGNNSSNET